jgi:hypothetical protein
MRSIELAGGVSFHELAARSVSRQTGQIAGFGWSILVEPPTGTTMHFGGRLVFRMRTDLCTESNRTRTKSSHFPWHVYDPAEGDRPGERGRRPWVAT